MIEHEIKLSIRPGLIRDPVILSPVYEWAFPYIASERRVMQLDSYRDNDAYANALTRLRAQEESVVLCYKETHKEATGLMSRIEREETIATGFKPKQNALLAREMRSDLPEFAFSVVRRDLLTLVEDGNQAEMCIDLGAVFAPDDTKIAVISEVELELKRGKLDWLQAKAHEMKSYVYELTGYKMQPSHSKGHIARVASQVYNGRLEL